MLSRITLAIDLPIERTPGEARSSEFPCVSTRRLPRTECHEAYHLSLFSSSDRFPTKEEEEKDTSTKEQTNVRSSFRFWFQFAGLKSICYEAMREESRREM